MSYGIRFLTGMLLAFSHSESERTKISTTYRPERPLTFRKEPRNVYQHKSTKVASTHSTYPSFQDTKNLPQERYSCQLT